MKYLWYLAAIGLLYLECYLFQSLPWRHWASGPTIGVVAALSWTCLWKGVWHDFNKKYNKVKND